MLGVYCLIVLAFSPCGDGFSVDALGRRRANKGQVAYGYSILLMQLLVAWSYFSSALIKLRVAGFGYFDKDNLPALAILHSLDNLHDTHFRLAFSLPAIRDYLPIVVALVLLWELLFPLAVFWKRVRWWFLGIGVLFHLSTLVLMNIFFPFHLAMYSVFVNWPRFAAWLANNRFLRRPVSWWGKFRSVPEDFPDLRINGLSTEGLLLWDGDCGFCSSMVGKMKRIARRPFAETPYQFVKTQLPEPILRWSNRQAHWIDSEGRVTGGSGAFVELLDQSGRPFWAALLSSAPLRPFLWLGYRFVAANRGWLGSFLR
jgi:predicted DCC family thiol-disulfide oxidoreductase YuxK